MSTNVLIVNRGPYDVSLKSAGSKVVLRKGDYRDVVVYPGAVFLIEEILPDSKAETDTPVGDAPFGRDQFNTPYVSEADRARGEALRGYAEDEAKNYTGTVNPDDLREYDWAFYVNTGLWKSGKKDYAIFTKKPIPRRNDGSVFNNPEAELAGVDVSGYTGPLKGFA